MSFKTYNNNDNQPVNTTYSAISFSNPDALEGSKINISYFNKLLQITILKKNGAKNNYATYEDNKSGTAIYVSVTKAKVLYELLQMMKQDESIHNVCIETNKGLLTVSDGSDYGTQSPCISISVVNNDGGTSTAAYQTKANYHKGAFNYDKNAATFTDKFFNDLELETFENVLLQYINAGTYAIAATVMEAGMYKRNALRDTVYQIAEKVGVEMRNNSNNSGGGYNNKSSFLNSSNNTPQSNNGEMNGIPKEYESATFDDIAHTMSN